MDGHEKVIIIVFAKIIFGETDLNKPALEFEWILKLLKFCNLFRRGVWLLKEGFEPYLVIRNVQT